jgi:hypothetical protein
LTARGTRRIIQIPSDPIWLDDVQVEDSPFISACCPLWATVLVG